jgi:hypothetical protein
MKLHDCNFPSEPLSWCHSDLSRWIRFTMQQYNIDSAAAGNSVDAWTTDDGSEMDGRGFVQMSEQEFRDRMPQVTSVRNDG